MKKTIAVLLVVCFLLSVTATAVSACEENKHHKHHKHHKHQLKDCDSESKGSTNDDSVADDTNGDSVADDTNDDSKADSTTNSATIVVIQNVINSVNVVQQAVVAGSTGN